jgi:hypothetical protein
MRLFFQICSVILHPVFVPLYAVLLLQYANPYKFGIWGTYDYAFILGTILFNAIFFPLVATLLMKALGFIDSLELRERQERIFVLIATCVFYIWTVNVFIRTEYDSILTDLMVGATISVSLALVVHSLYKRISWHTLGMGGLVAISIYIARMLALTDVLPYIALIILAAGLAGTARLGLGAHSPQEVWKGYMYGFLCMSLPLLF